jgi:hypothetical protein
MEISLSIPFMPTLLPVPKRCHDSGTPSTFVVKLTVTESSACICKKSLTESISDLNL